VAVLAAIVLPPLLREDDDLVVAYLIDHRSGNGDTGDNRGADGHVAGVPDHEHLAQLDGVAGLARQALNTNDVVLGDLILLAAGFDDCEHGSKRLQIRKSGPRARLRVAEYSAAARSVNGFSRISGPARPSGRPGCRTEPFLCGNVSSQG